MREGKNTINKFKNVRGFTLIEVIIALALFITIGSAVYRVTDSSLEVITRNQWRIQVVSIIEREIEITRNMKYQDVGIVDGFPVGKLLAEKTVNFRGLNFKVTTTVRSIDDPFDGTLGGTPNDTAPADYKLVEFEVTCLDCPTLFNPIIMTTTVAPENLETSTNNGALFVNVFDASGLPIQGVDVLVSNQVLNPTITISDETNASGILQLVDIPTSTQAYEVAVGKNGYSSDKTYLPGELANPNPLKPHSTVATQAITSLSFIIDKVSTFNIHTSDQMCAGIQGVDLQIQGAKLIGTAPDVYKYSTSITTDANGDRTLSNLEWDSYTITNIDTFYDLAGATIISPVAVNPDSTVYLRLLVEPSISSALQIVVEDGSGTLITDASVKLEGTSYDTTKVTGVRSFQETGWSGANYSVKDIEIETELVPVGITLVSDGGIYATTSTFSLTSNTVDFGVGSTDFRNISWNPTIQPVQTGNNSLQIQIATNNDNSSWSFIGPDGTPDTYYSVSSSAIHSSHDGNRYLRYKVLLKTSDGSFTPKLEDINFEFSSGCIPSGQTFFNGLSTGTYTVTVDKTGFQQFVDTAVLVSSDWQQYKVILSP